MELLDAVVCVWTVAISMQNNMQKRCGSIVANIIQKIATKNVNVTLNVVKKLKRGLINTKIGHVLIVGKNGRPLQWILTM